METDDHKEAVETKQTSFLDKQVQDKLFQFDKLKIEFEELASNLICERKARSGFEAENQELVLQKDQLQNQVDKLTEESSQRQKTIEELERRRDMAKKEIQNLYGRIQKKEKKNETQEL